MENGNNINYIERECYIQPVHFSMVPNECKAMEDIKQVKIVVKMRTLVFLGVLGYMRSTGKKRSGRTCVDQRQVFNVRWECTC